MAKCEKCIHINICRKMNKWTLKSNDCGDYYEKPKKGEWVKRITQNPCFEFYQCNLCSQITTYRCNFLL